MSACAGRLRRDKSKNYNRKGTIEPQMRKSCAIVLMLLAGAGSASAQMKSAPADAGGGAYYEFMTGLQLELQGDGPGAIAGKHSSHPAYQPV